MSATATVIRGDARRLPLRDASVDLIVTSPPYWAQRSYTDGGEHYAGQIGAEPTPGAYIDGLIECTREWVRVLKPSGSMWVNLGDKYATRYASSRGRGRAGLNGDDDTRARTGQNLTGVPEKSLIGLPWRYAIRCVDDLGVALRAEVIWSKPNALPESVTDRARRSHETWFHLVKQQRYFAAVDAIREPHTSATTPGRRHGGAAFGTIKNGGGDGSRHTDGHYLGRLPGSVWSIPTQPLKVPAEVGVDHFAAFPMEWPRRIITGWSPSGICTACGEGRRPVTQAPVAAIIGEACACFDTSAPTRPAAVLDPFGGTGTTALVAYALGRCGISVDMSADYCRLARWRSTDPGQVAKAAGVRRKPARPARPQAALFDDAALRRS